MKVHPTLFTACLGMFLLLACADQPDQSATEEPAQRPNILFIMSDDHAYQAVSTYQDKLVETPNIDRIAREGVRFNRSFVTNSICGPSRAVMLTGKYSHKNGFRDNHDTFDASQMVFPKLLQQADYHTAIVGKWHLVSTPSGFDEYSILPGQGDYYNPQFYTAEDTFRVEGYTTDIITDMAIDVLERRDTNQPFCLLVHHKAPHRNWMPNTKHLNLFKDDIPLPDNFFDDYENRTAAAKEQDMRVADMFLSLDMKLQPEYYGKETGTGGMAGFDAAKNWARNYEALTPEQKAAWDAHYQPINEAYKKANLSGKALAEWKYQRYMKDYLRCVVSVDENVGRLLDYLDQNNLAENTIVVYTSDQGFYLGEHGWYDKRYMYEESFRMPLVMRYPPAIEAGSESDDLVLNLDFAPTFLDFAQVHIPNEIQGQSFRPLLDDESANDDWRESVYYHYYQSTGWHHVPKHYGVRTDRYKLLHYYEKGDWELFDLEKDPHEMNSVYADPAYVATVETLKAELDRLQVAYDDVPEVEVAD